MYVCMFIYIQYIIYIYIIIKTMCPPGYHHNGFVATHPFGHMMYIYMYIYIHTYIYTYTVCPPIINVIAFATLMH